MQKLILSIGLLINSMFITSAQNNIQAERLIDDFINSTKTEAIRSAFNLQTSGKNAVNLQKAAGIFILKGNQFYLEMDQVQVWFDGKTQWAYMQESNEVSITEPTEEELTATNPVSILSAYKKVSTIQFSNVKNEQNHIIVMTSKSKKDDIIKVEVQLTKASGNLSSIYLEQQKGEIIHLTLHNYQKRVPVNQRTFVFDKTKFQGVTVNDLR